MAGASPTSRPTAPVVGDTGATSSNDDGLLTLFLAGDVMTGRGVDQVLAHPCDPGLFEPFMSSALEYVALAEQANGPIRRPVSYSYIWGDALVELARHRPLARIVNLETAVTRASEPAPKGINYRMSPENLPCLVAAGIDCCVLANNHVLDWGRQGLMDTLETLEGAGIKIAGAGRDSHGAVAPAVLRLSKGGRLLVFAFGAESSGIPGDWAASADRPGVNFLADLSPGTVRTIAMRINEAKHRGDIVVASIHWGDNWGYRISSRQTDFAHALIDEAGVDVVHGHSSHHPKAIEVYRGRLILYGCGDFVDDYEGISGYESYRDDLVLMYLPMVRPLSGVLAQLTMIPFQIRNFRLNRALPSDAAWLCDMLNKQGKRFGTRVRLDEDHALILAAD